MGNCVACGKLLKKRYDKPPRPESKYCSIACKKSDGGATIECGECGKEYRVIASRSDKSKFCSKACFDKNQKVYKEIQKPCAFCKKPVKITKDNRNSGKVFCNRECLGFGRNPLKEKNCECCGTSFTAKYKSDANQYNKFCSVACYHNAHNEKVKCSCCGKEYSRRSWITKAGRGFNYCSRECQSKLSSGEHSHMYNHDNEYVTESRSHRQIRTIDGWRQEHRVLVEKYIGRKLTKHSEPVLHINGDNLDNDLTNLYVCSNNSEMGVILNNSEAPYPVTSNLDLLKSMNEEE